MARRKMQRAKDSTATREVLLNAATLVFAERGFAGARVDEIAARAGFNKALIYAYYGDKKGLYRAVLAARMAEFTDPVISETRAKEASPRRALEEVIRRYFRTLIKDRPFARVLAWELLSGGREGRDVILESAGPLLRLISELVRRRGESGKLPQALDPELFRSAVIALGLGYTVQHSAMLLARSREGTQRTDEEFVDHACQLLLDSPGGGGELRCA